MYLPTHTTILQNSSCICSFFSAHATLLKFGRGFQYILNIITVALAVGTRSRIHGVVQHSSTCTNNTKFHWRQTNFLLMDDVYSYLYCICVINVFTFLTVFTRDASRVLAIVWASVCPSVTLRQACRGYGYIHVWISDFSHPVDISMDIVLSHLLIKLNI